MSINILYDAFIYRYIEIFVLASIYIILLHIFV